MDIAKYYATLGIKVNRKEISKVEFELNKLERKLKSIKPLKIRISASSITIDQSKLTRTLGNALDLASSKVSFEITKFVVNDRALMAALLRAMRRLPPLPPSADPLPPRRDRERDTRTERDYRDRSSIRAGGAAGIASRAYGPAIAVAAAGYGLNWLNKRNQEIVSAELGANAILGETGPQDMSWLKDQANKVGFNWLEAAPEFTGFMGAASPLMGHKTSLDTFQAFNEFATTRHAPAIARKRALMALKQMAS